MNKWARAAPAILIGVLATLATGAFVFVAPAGAASDLQVTPVAAPGATGARVAVTLDPGASVKRSFVVANHSTTLRLTVRLAPVDATARSGGTVEFAQDASAAGPGSWLTLSDVVTTLEPGANVRVAMTVTPPDNATPGDVTAGLVVRVDHAARASDNQTVDAPAEVSIPVAIKVKGAATALVSIASVKAASDGGHHYLDITFQNSGATAATMSGQVRVAGTHPKTDPVRTTVPPLTHTKVRVPFVMPSGDHTVPVSVSTKDPSGNEATWGGDIGSGASVASASVPRTPVTSRRASPAPSPKGSKLPSPVLIVVALVFLAAAAWFATELRRNRASRRARVVPVATSAPAVPAGAAPVTAPVAEAASAPADDAHMGAVAVQLAALVASIDRLVFRLGEASVPAGAPAPPPANPAPQFFAPAASRAPAAAFDPYDWPTQEQLDDFAARRGAAQSDA